MPALLDRPPTAETTEPYRRLNLAPPLPEPLHRDVLRATKGWLGRHAISLPIVAGLLTLTVLLVGTGISHFPSFTDDEGTYVAEGWAFMHNGALSHYTYWYDHPPLGWIQLGLLTWLLGGLAHAPSAVAQARELMLLPALATAGLLYVVGRRARLARPFAALAVLLLIASPLGLQSLREVYLENFAMPWTLAAFALAISPRKRLWAYAGAGLCFAIAVLSKETMLLFLPGLLAAIGLSTDRRTRSFCLAAAAAGFVLVCIGYPLYAALKGELLPGPGHVSLTQAVSWQLGGRQSSGSLLNASSPARHLISQWTSVDPWLLGLGLAAGISSLAVRRLLPYALALLIAVLVAAHGGYLPEPFVIGLLPFCALCLAGLLDAAVKRRHPATLAAAALIAVIFAAAALPGWVSADRASAHTNATTPLIETEHWVEAHVPRKARLLVDDTFYVDLVRAGFTPRYGVVWFYKLGFGNNLDPALVRHLPKGWREFDYVISSPVIRSAMLQEPSGYGQVTAALTHSRTVASFGTGNQAFQVRRILSPTGSGAIPKPAAKAAAPASKPEVRPYHRAVHHKAGRRRR